MTEARRRALRTFFQALLALLPTVPMAIGAFDIPAGVVAKVGGTVTVLVALVSWLMNTLEERGVVPTMLRQPGPVPMTDPVEPAA